MNLVTTEYRPGKELLPFVESYWLGDFNLSGEPEFTQSVVPNGCIELIIHLSDSHCSLSKGNAPDVWSSSPDFTLLGLYAKPYDVRFSENVKVFGIRFHPDGVRNIFGLSPAEFLATYEDGVDLLGGGVREFCSRIRELQNVEARVELADRYLGELLEQNHRSHDYTHRAMRLIRQVSGLSDYGRLTDQVPISDRQLQREFRNRYGITVREYMRLARLNAVQKYMRSGKVDLTRLSHDLQFHDQSHFIREFKNFVGLPPRAFIKRRDQFIVNPAVGRIDIDPDD